MKRLKAEDLFNLKYGDKVFQRQKSYTQTFRYVGRMPCSPDQYLIFSCGEILKHLYISSTGSFKGEWFSGDFDDKFFIQLQIDSLEKELETLRYELTLQN